VRRGIVVVAVLATAAAVATAAHASQVSPVEALAGQIASDLAGRAVSANCHDARAWSVLAAQQESNADDLWSYVDGTTTDGTDFFPNDVIELSSQACAALDAYRAAPAAARGRRCARRYLKSIANGACPRYAERLVAIETIAHESQHLKGIRSEATAECYGVQYHATVSQRFGATAAQARAMAIDYFTSIYPILDAEYHSAECRQGGALDLNLSAGFPT
jgi:hypothetical protein